MRTHCNFFVNKRVISLLFSLYKLKTLFRAWCQFYCMYIFGDPNKQNRQIVLFQKKKSIYTILFLIISQNRSFFCNVFGISLNISVLCSIDEVVLTWTEKKTYDCRQVLNFVVSNRNLNNHQTLTSSGISGTIIADNLDCDFSKFVFSHFNVQTRLKKKCVMLFILIYK